MPLHISRRDSLICLAGTALALTSAGTLAATTLPGTATAKPDALRLDPSRYQTQTVSAGGQTLAVRAYENLVYVRHPVDTTYQVMNIYVPEAYFHGQQVGGWTADTAPIFFPNRIGGYMPARPGTPQPATQGPQAGKESTLAAALLQGLVVAAPGARGRTTQNSAGVYTGKAPSAIIDLKAAVRYLRFNAGVLPGDTEKIVSNGTSAGGALSALLGASGNAPDYAPDLAELGAADARDDIFAVSAYCPITNLENADAAHEWQFNGVNEYRKIEMNMLDFNVARKEVSGTLTPAQMQVSNQLKQLFPAYVNSLKLRTPSGDPLTLDDAGNGSFREWVKRHVIASAQAALDAGQDMSAYRWVTVVGGQVQDLDFDSYVRYLGRMKLPPAFDALDLSSGENSLFGTASIHARHFTAYAASQSTATPSSRADEKLVKMMNAMRYIGAADARTAPNWRIRHGTADRDTSLAISTLLATSLQGQGRTVDFAMPWNIPHGGDYDLDQLFAWIRNVTAPTRP